MEGRCVGGKFSIGTELGAGSFGTVHLGYTARTGTEVAIKLEPLSSRHQRLLREAQFYKLLGRGKYTPEMHWHGTEANYNIIVMDLMGLSLQDFFDRHCNRKMSLKTVLMLGDQMVSCIQHLHSKGIVHRDIKPDNFVVGLGEASSKVHIIDFGLSRSFRSATGEHIPYSEGRGFSGTARYASINAQKGILQSRRDDLVGLGHVLLFFLRGSLPWQGLRARSKPEKYQKILEAKEKISVEELCKGQPDEVQTYLSYCRSLTYEETPDYERMKDIFKSCLTCNGLLYDCVYDWIPESSPPEEETSNVKESLTENEKEWEVVTEAEEWQIVTRRRNRNPKNEEDGRIGWMAARG